MGDIEGVHPAVLKELKQMAPEPLVGLRALRDEVIKDTFEVPRIAVVPVPGRNKYWVWAGIRAYLRLIDLKWPHEFSVLNYGLEMPEKRIVDLARADFRFAYIFSRQSAKSDRAIAYEWEEDYLLIPDELVEAIDALPAPRGADKNCPYLFWNGKSQPKSQISQVSETLSALFRKSGVANCHPHRFRHSLATSLVGIGATFEEVADVLGNSPEIVRKHYAKWSKQRQERLDNLVQTAEDSLAFRLPIHRQIPR